MNNLKPKYKPMIYVCHPFRAPDLKGVKENIRMAIEYGKFVESMGLVPLIPHVNSCALFGHINDTPKEDSIIVDYDIEILRRCDGILVCGDRISGGMATEIEFCKERGIYVDYTHEHEKE